MSTFEPTPLPEAEAPASVGIPAAGSKAEAVGTFVEERHAAMKGTKEGWGTKERVAAKGKFEKRRGIISPFLRTLQLFALICSFTVMLKASVMGLGFSSLPQAFKYLTVVVIIAAVWSFFQLLLDIFHIAFDVSPHSMPSKTLLLLLDFVQAFILLLLP